MIITPAILDNAFCNLVFALCGLRPAQLDLERVLLSLYCVLAMRHCQLRRRPKGPGIEVITDTSLEDILIHHDIPSIGMATS